MAERWAVATGNWSNTATWNGGTLPSSGDTVHANTYTVTIDQDITVTAITTAAGGTAAAGGGFSIGTSHTLNCNITAGTTSCLTLTSSGWTITINGDVTGGGSSARGVIRSSGGGTNAITINGNITGGSAAGARGCDIASGTNSLVIVGNVTGGTNGTADGLVTASGTTLDMTGSVAAAVAIGASLSESATISGDVSGSGSSNIYGIRLFGTSKTLTIAGTVTGGTAAGSLGVGFESSGGTLTVTTQIVGGSNATAQGVRMIGNNSTLILSGSCNNNQTAPPVSITGAGVTIQTPGTIVFSTAGASPFAATAPYNWLVAPTTIITMEPVGLGDQIDFAPSGSGGGGGLLRAGGFSGGVRRTN